MSREPKRMEENIRGSGKIVLYISVTVVIFIVIVAYAIMFNNIQEKNEDERLAEIENQEKIAEQQSLIIDLGSTEEENLESVSTQIGKTVEEKEKEASVNKDEKNTTLNEETSTNKSENTIQNKETKENTIKKISSNNTEKNIKNETKKEEPKKEITFIMPVEGEIVRGFAKDSLVYSKTLQEWIVHQAIDIKANSRDVVKASAEGTVSAIKNDPRYGLTVIIEHADGFKTVYSNLLTAEFVVEGEQVKQGQTIGTIGSSATFEIADEPHLHFEMLKDSIYVDPSIYIN